MHDTFSQNNSNREYNKPFKVTFRFRWSGIEQSNPNPCAGGNCGMCLGICIKVEMRYGEHYISPTDSLLGMGHATAVLVNDSLLKMTFDRSCDNGNGTTRILENFFMGSEISDSLDCDSAIIKEGIYTIDYSGSAFGKTHFNVILK